MQARTATVGDTPIRWLEQGSGAPVVLVHGIPTSPALWRHVMPLLPELRVLAFEMTGYGESIPTGRGRDPVGGGAGRTGSSPGWSSSSWVRRPWSGTTSGGGVVQIAAVRRPDLCAGLMNHQRHRLRLPGPIPSVKAMRAAAPLLSRATGTGRCDPPSRCCWPAATTTPRWPPSR